MTSQFGVKIDFIFFITARKQSLGQGDMFTGVCLSTGGCLVPWGWGAWSRGVPAPGGLVPRGACSRGVWSGGVPGPGEVPAWGGGLVWEGCLVETPRTATAAGGTHPTGMHSCLVKELVIICC